MTEPVSIGLILLIFDDEAYAELHDPLKAALAEVDTFYNVNARRVDIQQLDFSKPIKDGEALGSLWVDAKGSYPHMFDQKALGLAMEVILDPLSTKVQHHIIITDWEITPPEGLRYLIWDDCPGGDVVSLAPMDPNYWQVSDPDRIARIKHRARTACLSIVGSFLGYERCENPDCVLFANVDSVGRLDSMVLLGKEHAEPDLEDHGFSTISESPATTKEVEYMPESRAEYA